MERIYIKSNELVNQTSLDFTRYLYNEIEWSWRLIGVTGPRGVGKTTMVLQRLKSEYNISETAIYISLDDLYFSENKLTDFVTSFRQKGGKYLFIDEVHKYLGWARELKNIYDIYPDLFIVFTGSSIIDILQKNVDLSRRAVIYNLHGLSFREYLDISSVHQFKTFSLEDVIFNHTTLAAEITGHIKPIYYFSKYLKNGVYPFFIENEKVYYHRLEQILKLVIESDLDFIEGYDPKNARKISQLLYILSSSVPFKPNITKLSERIGISRNTLVQYIHYLDKANIINTLYSEGKSISILQKPDKIYLNNTNLSFLLSDNEPDKGNLRETFFLNQVSAKNRVTLPSTGDFIVNGKYYFETGGKSKSQKQIRNLKNAYIAKDDIETGVFNQIPLWLFGFLY